MNRTPVICAVLILAAIIGALSAIRLGALNPEDAYLKSHYTDARSRFISIEGVPMHVVEEGQGPAIILIHGHLGSNRQWDGWADDLRQDHRVIRFDYPPFGLSGPDPTTLYSSARAYPLIVQLIEELGYERFYLAGTSSGSIIAMRYASEFPERVDKLLLSTVPAYNPGDRLPPHWTFASLMWLSDKVLKVWRPKLYWRLFLENVFGDDSRITPLMVQEYADLNNRPGAIENTRSFIIANASSTFDVAAAAAKITSPILLQWAGKSPVLTPAGLALIEPMFENTEVKVIQYPELGHKLMLENPEQTVSDARAFLSVE